MVLGTVKIVRFLYQINFKSDNKGTKIGQKSGKSFTDFLLKSGNMIILGSDVIQICGMIQGIVRAVLMGNVIGLLLAAALTVSMVGLIVLVSQIYMELTQLMLDYYIGDIEAREEIILSSRINLICELVFCFGGSLAGSVLAKSATKSILAAFGDDVGKQLITKFTNPQTLWKYMKKLRNLGFTDDVIKDMVLVLDVDSVVKLSQMSGKGLHEGLIQALSKNEAALKKIADIADLKIFNTTQRSWDDIVKLLAEKGDEFIQVYRSYGDEVVDVLNKCGSDAIINVRLYKQAFIELALTHGDEYLKLYHKYGQPVTEKCIIYMDELFDMVAGYGDDFVAYVVTHGDTIMEGIRQHGNTFVTLLLTKGDDLVRVYQTYGVDAIKTLVKCGSDAIGNIDTYGRSFIDMVLTHGDEYLSLYGKYGKDVTEVCIRYSDELFDMVSSYGDDLVEYVIAHGDTIVEGIRVYGEDFFTLLLKHEDTFARMYVRYGEEAYKVFVAHSDELLELTVSNTDEAIELVVKYGDEVLTGIQKHGDDFMKKYADKGEEFIDEYLAKGDEVFESGKNTYVTDKDIEQYRSELGNPINKENNPLDTIAVGKTNIPELEGIVFRGASPEVRKAAGIGDLDTTYPDRSIKSPYDNPAFVKHAEEGVMAEFEKAVKDAGLNPKTIQGDLYMMQSFGDGVCNKCTAGLLKDLPSGKKGIFKQFSEMYPNLNVHVSTYSNAIPGGSHGLLSFDIIDGNVMNIVKK